MKDDKKEKKIIIEDRDLEEEEKETGEDSSPSKSQEKGSDGGGEAEEAEEAQAEAEESETDGKEDTDSSETEASSEEGEEAPGDKRDCIIADLKDRFQRQLAEFENFRKRTEKEKSGMFEAGSRSVIEKILPVVDNFERALESPPEDEASKAFTEGVGMIYKQLMQELEKLGTERIDAVGKPFDPDLHNAVMQEASEEYESGTVVKELQKGYTYHGVVVRHSMVSVAE